MYEPRLYRNRMNQGRFRGFRIVAGETDLWTGVDHKAYTTGMEPAVREFVAGLRKTLVDYIRAFPAFLKSFVPIPVLLQDPPVIAAMKNAGKIAGTGPMAAVAGMIAQETGLFLERTFTPGEYVVENGGDIYLKVLDTLTLSIEAGENHRFDGLGLQLTPSVTPAGICTSSGMFGHSVSLGKADSVTVVCPSACEADALATGIANRIRSAADIDGVVQNQFTGSMLSLVCIKDEKIGIRGRLQITGIPGKDK